MGPSLLLHDVANSVRRVFHMVHTFTGDTRIFFPRVIRNRYNLKSCVIVEVFSNRSGNTISLQRGIQPVFVPDIFRFIVSLCSRQIACWNHYMKTVGYVVRIAFTFADFIVSGSLISFVILLSLWTQVILSKIL